MLGHCPQKDTQNCATGSHNQAVKLNKSWLSLNFCLIVGKNIIGLSFQKSRNRTLICNIIRYIAEKTNQCHHLINKLYVSEKPTYLEINNDHNAEVLLHPYHMIQYDNVYSNHIAKNVLSCKQATQYSHECSCFM